MKIHVKSADTAKNLLRTAATAYESTSLTNREGILHVVVDFDDCYCIFHCDTNKPECLPSGKSYQAIDLYVTGTIKSRIIMRKASELVEQFMSYDEVESESGHNCTCNGDKQCSGLCR